MFCFIFLYLLRFFYLSYQNLYFGFRVVSVYLLVLLHQLTGSMGQSSKQTLRPILFPTQLLYYEWSEFLFCELFRSFTLIVVIVSSVLFVSFVLSILKYKYKLVGGKSVCISCFCRASIQLFFCKSL